MNTVLINGKVITPIKVIDKGGVIIEEGKIKEVFAGEYTGDLNEDNIIDVGGNFISPGFIDIHTHGGSGYSFQDGTPEAVITPAKAHMLHGTTSILPTFSSSTIEELLKAFDGINQAKKIMKDGPNILGIHIEGPYFSQEEKGAQDPKVIRKPNKEEYMKILGYSDDIVRWSIAPELEGALEMAKILTDRGILCSAAHTNAIYEQMLDAFESGFTHITHLYSGCSSVRRINAYRYAGVVESAYLIDEMTVEIIADGKHLPESLLKLVYKIKGPDKICLVTDSVMPAMMPEGEYARPDGRNIIVEDGVAKLTDRKSFAGSVATADRLVRTMVNLANVPLQDAVKMITLTPARIMKINDKKGSISCGKDADIVVFDDDINMCLVLVNGQVMLNNLTNYNFIRD